MTIQPFVNLGLLENIPRLSSNVSYRFIFPIGMRLPVSCPNFNPEDQNISFGMVYAIDLSGTGGPTGNTWLSCPYKHANPTNATKERYQHGRGYL
jgi:hypothetical protein